MRKVASHIKDRELTEHLDEMQLALFVEDKLDEKEKEDVWKHLSQCKRCREVLHLASQIEKEEKKELKPANNTDYKKLIVLPISASLLIMIGAVPPIQNFPDEHSFKGITQEKSYLDKVAYYWECRFEEIVENIFGGDKS